MAEVGVASLAVALVFAGLYVRLNPALSAGGFRACAGRLASHPRRRRRSMGAELLPNSTAASVQ